MRDSACWVTGATTTDRNIETKNGPKRTTSWIRHDKPGTHVQTTPVPEGRHKAESGTAVPGCRTKNSRVPKGRHIAYPGVAMPGRNDPEPGTGRLNGTPQNPGHGKLALTFKQHQSRRDGTMKSPARQCRVADRKIPESRRDGTTATRDGKTGKRQSGGRDGSAGLRVTG
jgi:hypothetical protein